MRKVETDCFRVEILEWNLVDRGRVGIGIEMARRINVRAGMVAHRQIECFRREPRLAGDLGLAMVIPNCRHDGRMGRMRRRTVIDFAAEVDQGHGGFL